ncbi:MAG: DUF2946 family protein [Burkholderiaceae bacterium]|nr:DUF2946 family protein [Burkholderiaceae bacterium]MEB2350694.1 DUF2946 family protein [Burkholderiaceae bacterium]
MTTHRSHRLTAWIACLAVLTGVLAPSIGHLVTATRGFPLLVAELCSVNPIGRTVIRVPVAAEGEPATPTPGPTRHNTPGFAHCPACPGSADPGGPPPAAAPSFVAAVVPDRPLPALAAAPTGAAPAWTPANPRAPPPSA